MAPADEAANNVVAVRWLHYVNTLKPGLGGTKAYEQQLLAEEMSVVNDHISHSASKFAICVKEGQDRLL